MIYWTALKRHPIIFVTHICRRARKKALALKAMENADMFLCFVNTIQNYTVGVNIRLKIRWEKIIMV